MKIIPANTLKTAMWQGGTTTELYIFPENALYKERNFLFRISTATIEAPDSTFTKLPGIRRKIMVLDGEIELTHEGKYSKTLKKFDTDSFMGDWETHSVGLATDFNLMMAGSLDGQIRGFSFKAEECKDLEINRKASSFLLYACSGSFELTGKRLNTKDVAIFDGKENPGTIQLKAVQHSEIALVEVWKAE